MTGQQESDNRDGFKCIPWVKAGTGAATATIYSPFGNIYLVLHVDTDGTAVSKSVAAGSTSVAITVAKNGNILVWGDGSGAASVVITI